MNRSSLAHVSLAVAASIVGQPLWGDELPVTAPIRQSKVYWTDAMAGTISRSDLDGTQVEVLISGLHQPRGIAIDAEAGHFYFTMSSLHLTESGKVVRANLDGSDQQILVDGLHVPRGIALDLKDRRVYWSNYGGGTERLQRARLHGSDVETLVLGAEAYELAIDARAGQVYWTHINNDTGGVGHRQIRRAALDRSSKKLLLDDLGTPDGIALDPCNGKMYWTDQSYHTVSRANLDGSEVELLIELEPGARPFGIDLDLAAGKMYWVDWELDVVRRANLDGTLLETLIDTGLEQPLGIALLLLPGADISPRDLTCDGDVNFDDLLLILASWGPCIKCRSDLNGDGAVDFDDLLALLAS